MGSVTPDYLESIQIIAFDLVSKVRRGEPVNDLTYTYDRIFRWYSKIFSTPLHLVYDLPEQDVLEAYWREHFEGLSDEELEEERLDLIKTEEQRAKDNLRKDYEDLEFFEDSKLLEDEEPVKKLESAASKFQEALGRFKDGMGKETSMTDMPVTTDLPPNIKMRFISEEELMKEIDEKDSLGLLDKPRK